MRRTAGGLRKGLWHEQAAGWRKQRKPEELRGLSPAGPQLVYKFRLSAFAYRADVMPEKDREFRFEGDKAVEHRKRLGQEQEYDENGNPKPVIFRLERMVAYLPEGNAYPDDAEFQSPVFGRRRSISAFGTSFWELRIAIARDDEDVVIPLIAKKSCFSVPPKAQDPVRGVFWLQGYSEDVAR